MTDEDRTALLGSAAKTLAWDLSTRRPNTAGRARGSTLRGSTVNCVPPCANGTRFAEISRQRKEVQLEPTQQRTPTPLLAARRYLFRPARPKLRYRRCNAP